MIGRRDAARHVGALLLLLFWPAGLRAQSIVIDHTSVAQYDALTTAQFDAATALRMMFVDRSVGANQWAGLAQCLAVNTAASPAFCRRNQTDPRYVVPASELAWGSGHPVPAWQYFGWDAQIPPALPVTDCHDLSYWYGVVDCFIRWADAHADEYRVAMMQLSYLEVMTPGIESAATGFFARGQPTRADIGDYEAMVARHPNTKFVLATSSLARGIGTPTSTTFNEQVRAYAASHQVPLFDVAAIEAHTPDGAPCVGTNGADAAICQHYTSETSGGHLGAPSAGMIRLSKAWWVLMARLAGGTLPPLPPTNVDIVGPTAQCTLSMASLYCSFADNVGIAYTGATITARDAAGNTTTVVLP